MTVPRSAARWLAVTRVAWVMVALQGIVQGFAMSGVLGGLLGQTVITELCLMIPLSIGVAILRSCLFDADVALDRALSGENFQLAIVASTLAIAALFNPLRRLQSIIRSALLPQEVRCFPYTCGLW